MKDCTHKTERDHVVSTGTCGTKIWKCSACGKVEPWGESWSWFGGIECASGLNFGNGGCGWAIMESVACSKECAATNAGA